MQWFDKGRYSCSESWKIVHVLGRFGTPEQGQAYRGNIIDYVNNYHQPPEPEQIIILITPTPEQNIILITPIPEQNIILSPPPL